MVLVKHCFSYFLGVFFFTITSFIYAQSLKCPALTGDVITKSHSYYAKARLDSNYYTSKNKFPQVIVYAHTVKDVQHAIQYARCYQLPIRIRSGGHNHESFSTGTGIVLIDVSKIKQLKIDKKNRIVTLQPGLTGGELYRHLFKEGLTQDGGTCSDVGISGLILTGGMGPLYRRAGIACDSLLSLDMVNAKGEVIHATHSNQYKDLFWASCGGGGGNFGVVTAMTIKVYPATNVTWFNIGWDWEQPIEKVITTWQQFFGKNDNRWFSHLDIWAKAFPTKKFNKMPVKVLGVFYGTPDEARKALTPFLQIGHPKRQVIKLVNWQNAIKQFEDATSVFITAKPEYKSTGAYALKELPPQAIKTIITTLRNTSSPLFNVLFFSLGDMTNRIGKKDTAYFYRDAKFFVMYSIQWLHAANAKQQIAEVDTLRKKLLAYTQGDYIGNPDRSISNYLKTYYGENLTRLRCIKRKYDPDNIFHFEQSIPEATDSAC